MHIITKFEILQTVSIPSIETKATVVSVRWDYLGVRYEVEYWLNGDRKYVLLCEHELAALKNKEENLHVIQRRQQYICAIAESVECTSKESDGDVKKCGFAGECPHKRPA